MDEAPPKRLRGTSLQVVRVAALAVSIGVVALLMVRASAGCHSAPPAPVVPERGVSPSPSAALPASASAAPSSPPVPKYFPGSKAWGGDIVDPPAAPTPSASAKPRD